MHAHRPTHPPKRRAGAGPKLPYLLLQLHGGALAAREETAERLKNIFDNSEKINEALCDIADKDPLVQNDLLTQDEMQFQMFANAIRNDEYFRRMQLKSVDSRSERAAQQRTPLNDIQNNDELLPLEINDDMDDLLDDNNDGFLDDSEDIGDSY